MNRKEIVERQQAILDAAKREGRELTAEETREFESLQRSLDEMDAGEGQQGQRGQEGGETPEQMVQRALAAERQRIADITALCRSFNLDASEYISSGNSMEEVRAAVLENLQKNHAPINVRVTADEGDKFRDAATDAILLRSGISLQKPADGATQMRGMSLRDLAVECLSREEA